MPADCEAVRKRTLLQLPPLRLALPLAYGAVAALVFATHGIPLERGLLSVWILGALLTLSLGNLRSFGWSVLTEWVPLLAALTLYDVARGEGAGRFPEYTGFQIWLDQHVFGGGSVPTVWLQERLWNPARPAWFDVASWAVYMSYFLLTPIILGTLWLVDRPGFRSYARRLTLLSFAAAACFVAAPTTPPWLAASKGLIGPADRLVGPIGGDFPWFDGSTLWERGLHLANDLAAFPSLHEGMTILVAIMLWRRVPRGVRPLLVVYPLAMAFALVYTAEHYVCDLAAGALLAFLVCAVEPPLTAAAAQAAARLRGWRPSPSKATVSSSG